MRRSPLFCGGAGFMLLAAAASAGESAISLINNGMPAACAEYAENVSKSEGSFGSIGKVNGVSCYGAFQFCSAKNSPVGGTFSRYFGGSPSQFLNNPKAQVAAWLNYQTNEWATARRGGLDAAIGREICYRGQCATLTQSSILKACQFGCGPGGKLSNFVNSGFDCNAPGTKDGAGTSVCKYLISGAGYDVSCITNNKDGTNCLPGQ